ncbi:hypothetical protein V5O48_017031 [Marasmius crinis-equi]|uniref:Mid2 domain-containing protein n=1 Tax=Marasmius crinis-equi TaxID=585013 RepID=A0ABR3EQB5_9AGAR
MRLRNAVAALSFAVASNAQNVIRVSVGGVQSRGENIYAFSPANINASNGDVIQFEYTGVPANHSYLVLLQAKSAAVSLLIWWVKFSSTVMSPKLIMIYITGMIGAINAPTSGNNTFSNYQNNAKAAAGTTPGQAIGNLVGVGASASALPGPITQGDVQLFGTPTGVAEQAQSTTSAPNDNTNTTRATTQISGSQPTSQTSASSGSRPVPLASILGATLGGLFALGLIVLAIYCYCRHKRQRQARNHQPEPDSSDPGSTVDPFPSGQGAKTRRSRLGSEKKLAPTPEPVQHSPIVAANGATTTDTTVSETPSPNALPVANEPGIGPFAGFTTDELVVELNQRIQTQDGRWNENETLPEYPGSEREVLNQDLQK